MPVCVVTQRGCWRQARAKNKSSGKVQNVKGKAMANTAWLSAAGQGENKSKGKAQIANGKAKAKTATIQATRSWVFTFAFCDLRFAF
jgi:uncharacterized protein YjbJ (UPF0337 family)